MYYEGILKKALNYLKLHVVKYKMLGKNSSKMNQKHMTDYI